MKKTISVFVAVCMMLVCINAGIVGSAAENNKDVSITVMDAVGNVNEVVEVPIVLNSESGFVTVRFSLTFDETKLQWTGGEFSDVPGWDVRYDSTMHQSGSYIIYGSGSVSDTQIKNTVIYRAKFKILASTANQKCKVTPNVLSSDCFGENHTACDVTCNEGTVTANGSAVTVRGEDVKGGIGDTVSVPIKVKANNIVGIRFSLSYDENLLSWVGGSFPMKEKGWGLCSDSGTANKEYASGGYVIAGYTDKAGVATNLNGEVLYYAKFTIKTDRADGFDVFVNVLDIYGYDGAKLDLKGDDLSVKNARINVIGDYNKMEPVPVTGSTVTLTEPQPVVKIASGTVNTINFDAKNAPEKFVFDGTVKTLGDDLLKGWSGDVVLLNPRVDIGTNAFGFDSKGALTEEVTLYGWTGSTAQTYVNGLTGSKVKFVAIEEFKGSDYQTGIGENSNSFRYVARVRYAEYYHNANINIKVKYHTNSVETEVEKPVQITRVYKNLNSNFGRKTAPDGYCLSAISFINLPKNLQAGEFVEFTFTPDVTYTDKVVMPSVTLRYKIVDSKPSFEVV